MAPDVAYLPAESGPVTVVDLHSGTTLGRAPTPTPADRNAVLAVSDDGTELAYAARGTLHLLDVTALDGAARRFEGTDASQDRAWPVSQPDTMLWSTENQLLLVAWDRSSCQGCCVVCRSVPS